jgi:hypothetical protein
MDSENALLRFGIGILFTAYGLFSIRKRKVQFGLGGGRSSSSPIAQISLEGVSAVIFGLSFVIGGSLFALSFIFYWLEAKFSSNFVGNIPTYGVLIIFFGGLASGLIPSKSINVVSKLTQSDNNSADNEAT